MANNTKIGVKIQNTGINKAKATRDLQKQLNDIGRRLNLTIGGENAGERLANSFTRLTSTLNQSRSQVRKLNTSLKNINTSTRQVSDAGGQMTRSYLGNLTNIVKKFADWVLAANLIYRPFRELQKGIETIKELDKEMINIARVTNLTTKEMDDLYLSAGNVASQFGQLAKDYLSSVASFSKMGFKEQAQDLAQVALLMSNVGDIDVATSEKTLIKTMNAMKLETKDATKIVDSFNNISNNAATNIAELSKGVGNFASTAHAANMSLDETIALVGSAQAVTQKSGSEIGNAFRTISMRIQGVSDNVETFEEDLGKSEEALRSIGVETRATADTFKPVTEVLGEVAAKYEDMTDVEKSYVTEALSGKLRANILKGMLSNWEEYEKQVKLSQDSFGVSFKENQRYIESIDAKLNKLANTWTEFWQNSLQRGMIKNVIEFAAKVVDMGKAVGGLSSVLKSLVAGFITLKTAMALVAFQKWITEMVSFLPAVTNAQRATISLGLAYDALKTKAAALMTVQNLLKLSAGALAVGVVALTLVYQKNKQAKEEAARVAQEQADKYGEEAKSLKDLTQSYKDIMKSTSDTKEKKKQLTVLQEQLLETYGDEATKLDVVNGKYEDQIKLLTEQTRRKLENQQIALEPAYQKAKSESSKKIKNVIILDTPVDTSKINRYLKDIGDLSDESAKKLRNLKVATSETGEQTIRFSGTLKDQRDAMRILIDVFKKNDDIAANRTRLDILSDLSKQYTPLNKKVSENQNIIKKYKSIDAIGKISKDFTKLVTAGTDVTKALKSGQTVVPATIKQYSDLTKQAEEMIASDKLTKQEKSTLIEMFNLQTDSSKKVEKATIELTEAQKLGALSGEELEKKHQDLDKALQASYSAIENVSKALGEYEAQGKLNEDTLQNLITQYPELIMSLGDEEALREALIKIQKEEVKTAEEVFAQKLLLSDKFYNEYLKANQQMFNSLVDSYNFDLKNWGDLAKAKKDIDDELIAALGKDWNKFFDKQGTGWQEMSSQVLAGELTGSAYAEAMVTAQKYQKLAEASKKIDLDITNLTKVNFDKLVSNKIKSDISSSAAKVSKANEPKSSSSSSSSPSKYDPITASMITSIKGDRYYELTSQLTKINSLLETNASLQDKLSKNELASAEDRIKLIKEEIDLVEQKQALDHSLAEAKRKEANDLQWSLAQRGAKFDALGNITNLQAVKDKTTNALNVLAQNINQKNIEITSQTTSSAYNLGLPTSGTLTSGFGKRKSPTSGASSNHMGILNAPIYSDIYRKPY